MATYVYIYLVSTICYSTRYMEADEPIIEEHENNMAEELHILQKFGLFIFVTVAVLVIVTSVLG